MITINETHISNISTVYVTSDKVKKIYTIEDDSIADSHYAYLVNELFIMNLLDGNEGYSSISKFVVDGQQYILEMPNLGRPINHKLHDLDNVFISSLKLVADLHNNHIVHCDLKPANILIDDNGKVSIIDFTHSTLALSYEPKKWIADQMMDFCTTSEYASPETYDDTMLRSYNHDIWSLGCVFYELITGKYLIPDGIKMLDISDKLNSVTNQRYQTILKKMLVYDPEQRASAMELLKYFEINYIPRQFYRICDQHSDCYSEFDLSIGKLPLILNDYAYKLIYHMTPTLSTDQELISRYKFDYGQDEHYCKRLPEIHYDQYTIVTMVFIIICIVFRGDRSTTPSDVLLTGKRFFRMYMDIINSYKMSVIFA